MQSQRYVVLAMAQHFIFNKLSNALQGEVLWRLANTAVATSVSFNCLCLYRAQADSFYYSGRHLSDVVAHTIVAKVFSWL